MCMMNFFILLFLTLLKVKSLFGHARLMDPPARNSMWRLGYSNPINIKDDAVWCGGVRVQWSREVNGRCGVCGDSWLDPPPRKHETGGVYAKGIIGRRYTSGQLIKIEVEMTVNHQGSMEVRLCPFNTRITAESQECFDRYPLRIEGKPTYIYQVPPNLPEKVTLTYQVKLPDEVTCTHCVIQWIYRAAHFVGQCPNGTRTAGCGPQEIYYNCADIAITHGRGVEITELPPSKFEINEFAASHHGAEDIDVLSGSQS